MAKKATRYTAGFRAKAIRLAEESDEPLAEVARRLGVKYQTLHGWMEKAGKTNRAESSVVRTAETVDEEVRRLRKEVETLTMERDFLKKATAFFARTSK